jgi:sulfur carrier protein
VEGSILTADQPAAYAAFFHGATMQIIINGEDHSVPPQSMLQLLHSLEIDPRRVAVELNREILPKADYETTPLADGDRIEIVHFVGGG